MKKKIGIIYITNSLKIGGAQKVLIDSANNLDYNKYDVHVVSLTPNDSLNSISSIINIHNNIKVHYFNFNFFDSYSILGYFSLLFKKKTDYGDLESLISLINFVEPEILHFHTSPRELIIKKFLNTHAKYVFTDHTLRIPDNKYGVIKTKLLALIFRKLYLGYNIISVSEEIKNSLLNNKIIKSPKNILLILNGINFNDYNQVTQNNSDKLIVVYVSRIDNNKGHIDLIKAWSLLGDLNDKLLYIVGPDSLNGFVQSFAKKLGCMDSVVFTGSVTNPKDFISKANVGVYPSYNEGLPLALLEKMAMGLPVIVSDIKELTSIITDTENGLVFKLSNFQELSQKIRYLHLNRSIGTLMAKNAIKTVELKYNSIKSSTVIDQYYSAILKYSFFK